MNTPVRLGLYAAGLVLVFAGSAAVANVVVPEETVESWAESVTDSPAESPTSTPAH